MRCIVDIETDDLVATRIWVIVCKDIDTGKVYTFREPDLNKGDFVRFAKGISIWVGHNFIDFDGPTINRLIGPNTVNYHRVIDTLVVSRTLDYDIVGGHSLDAWGNRLGSRKGDFKHFRDFLEYWDEGLAYCIQDVEVNYKLFKKQEPYLSSSIWRDALRLEHDVAILCKRMSIDGFAFDIEGARSLHHTVQEQLSVLTSELKSAFPPKPLLVKEYTPKETKFGTISRTSVPRGIDDLTPYSVGASFCVIDWQEFNPGSPKQIVERLNAAGWKPFEKTKGHMKAERELRSLGFSRLSKREKDEQRKILEDKLGNYAVYGWSVSEENLKTLPDTAPEAARKLVQWLLLDSRRSTLEEWFNAYSEKDKRIHGKFNHIGAWTGRMSHAAPNMANIPSFNGFAKGREPSEVEVLNSRINPAMRSFWSVPPGSYLVGVDADGIQLRILAHYMEDPRFIEAILDGKKEEGTDMHSMNRKALGEDICRSRDDAKTFIYAWLLGAGIGKVAQILGCSTAEAREANDNFLNYYPGLKRLKEEVIPRDANAGYFQGVDGRLVRCDLEHYMLAGYLQNGESTVMKRATRLWWNRLTKERIPFKLVDFVHDEWQTEVTGDEDLAKYVAEVQAESIRLVGEELNLKCPLAGSIIGGHGQLSIGKNWSETH